MEGLAKVPIVLVFIWACQAAMCLKKLMEELQRFCLAESGA